MKATGSSLSTWRSLPFSEKEQWKQQWTDLMAAFKAGLDAAWTQGRGAFSIFCPIVLGCMGDS